MKSVHLILQNIPRSFLRTFFHNGPFARVLSRASVLGLVALATTLSGCTNSLRGLSAQSANVGGVSSTGTTGSSGTTSGDRHIISNITITAPSGVGAQTATVGIFFNTSQSTAPISNHCNTSGSGNTTTAKPCLCQFSWNETNPNSANASPIQRTVQTTSTSVQPSFLSCNAPDVYTTEIQAGTGIRITVLPAPGNTDQGTFSVNSFVYTKSSSTVGGSFSSANGVTFDNILHYACYQKFLKGLTITSKSRTVTDPNTGASAPAVYGSQFCIASGTSSSSSSSCNSPPQDYSVQAYYFNLFIRSSERGDVNQFNDSYICPMVLESLYNNSTIGLQNQPWPFDSTFALALSPNTTFSIGVEANTKLSGGQDPTAASNSCFSSGTSNGSGSSSSTTAGSIINSCLGFAAHTNSDGTCPNVTDSTGAIRSTYRLRRFMSVLPRQFETTGSPSSRPQAVDTIYVLDRPVLGPTTADPLKPYTMLGPKPCPYAFFDTKNVSGSASGAQYHATSDTSWSDKNFDGIEFPNRDTANSCSASLPILSNDKSLFSITTVNIHNNTGGLAHLWIRPQQAFFPHYEEDINFQACAPQASPIQDPPLHFSRDPISHNVAWCAESFPTQNPNIASLDPPVPGTTGPTGNVIPYTSHVVKRSASTACVYSQFNLPATATYTYPGGGAATHPNTLQVDLDSDPGLAAASLKADKTCDRTATAAGLAWPRFPLLAQPTQVESAINTDKSYFCTVTYDNGGGKTGLSTPSDGCCDANKVYVKTGTAGGSSAHLEPDVACSIPKY